ncbi:hypothetical protein GCM10010218_10680 [Streptomyces mashuensis]|uniref:Amino acid adenylation domain-containing protein n=1 Tax=Streptomyces mashuensis TaxID=33904 RepID=A0A919EBI6_9ACTN|nr:amino acid adenylation domain-containing protein [Streptomyces mashuensis]GHF31674.1 hypothetical protein GCM10010218_10680 [Streptomyces mashuensis]
MQLHSTTVEEAASTTDLITLFTTSARAAPDRTALTADGTSLTYKQLDEWSGVLAGELSARGVQRGDRVALRMPAGAEAVVTMLGILKSGAAYVPLDVRNPPERNAYVLADSGATLAVGDFAELPAGLGALPTEEVTALRGRPPAADPPAGRGPGPGDLAYVIYTSGTTGRPKGVPVRHGNAAALFAATPAVFDFGPQDRWLLFHSIAFDFSVWEIWGAFTHAATLVVLDHWSARTPEQYLAVLADEGVTVLSQTPTAFTALAEAALRTGRDLPDLRYVVFGGEKVVPAALRPWAKRFGLDHPQLVNGYGITETTVFTTFHRIGEEDLEGEASVIGVPLPGFRIRVVDDAGEDVPDGTVGELWLAGPQVTDGYLGREELTAERFPRAADPADGRTLRYYRSGDLVARAPDGSLHYEGRADLQVKLRGHRIELSDVEAAVRRHDAVADAVVTVRRFAAGDDRLVCAYVPRAGHDPQTRELRAHVKALLPSYMHPARYLRLPDLPMTVNGKVDRAAVARSWEEGVETG